jgi:hypothetical protein
VRVLALAAALVVLSAVPAVAGNRANGGNSGSSSQSGSSTSGDAIGGPSIGVAHAGDVSVVATNVSGLDGASVHAVTVRPGAVASTNVQGPTSVSSGDASGANTANAFVGLTTSPSALADVFAAVLT